MSLSPSSSSSSSSSDYTAGLLILFAAQLLSAFMGNYTEQTYAQHGKHWREILFYSHALGLVFSISLYPQLRAQWTGLMSSSSSSSSPFSRLPASSPKAIEGFNIPPQLLYLLANAITQVACISGVNLLSARTSAVMVTVVLNVRKLVSFLLSCVVFGNPVSGLMALGAGLVFVAGAVYGWDESRRKRSSRALSVSGAGAVEGAGGEKLVEGLDGTKKTR